MALIDALKTALGSAWHVNSNGFLSALLPAVDGVVEASKVVTADANGAVAVGAVAGAATVKGIYLSATVAVAVPTIADAEDDLVAVDVAAAFTMQPAVGDAVIAIPLAALPTDCILEGAYITATDEITVAFGTKEGGSGVTGANKDFKFLVIDLT